MSRIWEAIKQARLERSQRRSRGSAARRPQGERRANSRRAHEAELLVYGSGDDAQPFHEGAPTVDASDTGCLLMLETPVAPGQRLFLTNATNQAEQECRVVHVSEREHGKIRVGVEFRQAAHHFWALAESQ